MQTYFGVTNLGEISAGSVVTVGNFDGVHLGHQSLLERLLHRAKEQRVSSAVLSFDPHPMEVLRPESSFLRLFSAEDQKQRLEQIGIDHFVIEKFTKEFAAMNSQVFLESYLFQPFQPRHLVIGYDFAFGAQKEGTQELLREFASRRDCGVEVVEPVRWRGEIVSSSLIRKKIMDGEIKQANHLLSRPYFMTGTVQKGDQRGRAIGFRTANTVVVTDLKPKQGVYLSSTLVKGQRYSSISNLGVRPTFQSSGGTECYLETHIFEFDEDIYDVEIKVELLDFLREEKKFDQLSELQEQIRKDCRQANEVHGEVAGDWRKI